MSRFLMDRGIFDNDLWNDPVRFRVFFYLVGKAAFKDGVKAGAVVLQRGQYLRSYRNIQKDLEFMENRSVKRYSLETIRRSVKQLVKDGRIKIEESELGTLFTVLNYEQYQAFEASPAEELETEKRQQRDGNETTAKQLPNNKNECMNECNNQEEAVVVNNAKNNSGNFFTIKRPYEHISEEDWIRRQIIEDLQHKDKKRVDPGLSLQELSISYYGVKKRLQAWSTHPIEKRMAAFIYAASKPNINGELSYATAAIQRDYEGYLAWLPHTTEMVKNKDYEVEIDG